MKRSQLPFLDLDSATALALPLADTKARAQHRFCFRLPNGEEEWLLARLCAIQPDHAGKRLQHCVVLRPENAEATRVFVAENLWYRAGRRELHDWMTPAQAERWKWELFEQSFNDNDYVRRLARLWSMEKSGQTTLLKFGADGGGEILSWEQSQASDGERFNWQRHRWRVSHEVADLRFLRTKNANFRRQIRARWNDPKGEVRYALRWSRLSEPEKSAIAFACERGTWAQLREIARLVLTVRIGMGAHNLCTWNLAAYGEVAVVGDDELFDDGALFAWRHILTETFGAFGVDGAGVKIDALPLCLWTYISDDDRTRVEVAPPTMHEIMQAQLKLRDWTNAHFAPDQTARLLDILTASAES